MNNSLWTKDVFKPSFPTLMGDLKADVLIIGGGMTGVLCAWKLHKAGIPYALIEADRIGSGITRNTTAKITVHHGLIYEKILRTYGPERARQYYAANSQALEEYKAVAEKLDCDLLIQNNYLYAKTSPAELEGEMHALQSLGIPFVFEENLSLPFSTAGGICMTHQAQFHPLKFLYGIARNLNIYEHTKALFYEDNRIITPGGCIRASKIITATHFPIWNKHGAYYMKMYQERSYVLALEGADPIEGMYLDASGNGLSLRRQDNMLLLGGGSHRTGKPGKGWDMLRNAAGQFYPNSREIVHWATQDCMTLDGIPYIGQYGKNTPNFFVATGFNKWGMTSSMTAANLLTDLVCGRNNDFASCFSPQRSMLHLQLLTNGMEAAASLLNPKRPKCPHLGCSLKWNPQEHSWDCPCHGSRFDEDGRVLDGPSTGNLPKKE